MFVVSEKVGRRVTASSDLYHPRSTTVGSTAAFHVSGHSRSFRSINESVTPQTDLYKIVEIYQDVFMKVRLCNEADGLTEDI
jgi:hypothetical protein